jgi:hypothetical protein
MGQRWRNWISALWCTASSSFLLNGEPGKRILHCRGVRQGDPLSPMPFLLAMEPLHIIFKKAQDWGLLKELSPCVTLLEFPSMLMMLSFSLDQLSRTKCSPNLF